MKSINLPALLTGIWFVWLAIASLGLHTLFGLFSLITGIVWLVFALGLIGRLQSARR